MPSSTMYPVFFGPIVALLLLGGLVLVLRWAFSKGKSVVAVDKPPGTADSYGLMRSVGHYRTAAEAQYAIHQLQDAQIRANLVTTNQGLHLMVFHDDLTAAQKVLTSDPDSPR